MFERIAAGLAAALILAGSASTGAAETGVPSLRAEVERLAATHRIAVVGAEHLADAPAMSVTGSVEERLTKLLNAYDFILLRGADGRPARLTIVRPLAPHAAAVPSPVPTFRDGAEHYVEGVVTGSDGRTLALRFLLDTGASTVVLADSARAALGIDADAMDGVTLQTANGRIEGRLGVLPALRIGESRAEDVAVAFLPDDQLGGKSLLGMSFLARFVLTIDDSRGEVTLRPRR